MNRNVLFASVRTAAAALFAFAAGCGSQTAPPPAAAPVPPPAAPAPVVAIETSMGEVTVELFADRAPETVANFLAYVDSGHYAGTIFHRVIDGFMIQGGGFSKEMQEKSTRAPVRNEATNGERNRRGTLAMARTPDPHSASAQFFVNVADNAFLDHRAPTPDGFGYCVFGRVKTGMDIVDRIKSVPTATAGSFENVPVEPVVIIGVKRLP